MAERENSRDLISVLWSGADILRSKMNANEYKDYLLGIVFYKYLSDFFLIKAYDLFNGDKSSKYPTAADMVSDGISFINAGDLENGTVNLIVYCLRN